MNECWLAIVSSPVPNTFEGGLFDSGCISDSRVYIGGCESSFVGFGGFGEGIIVIGEREGRIGLGTGALVGDVVLFCMYFVCERTDLGHVFDCCLPCEWKRIQVESHSTTVHCYQGLNWCG